MEQHQAKLTSDRPSGGKKKPGRGEFVKSAVGPVKEDSKGLTAELLGAQISQAGCRGVCLDDSAQTRSRPQQKKTVGTLLNQDITKFLVKPRKNV